jgi:hypothetical protein
VYVIEDLTLRDARKRVAWCMTDNANATHLEASRISDTLQVGVELVALGYAFTLVAS